MTGAIFNVKIEGEDDTINKAFCEWLNNEGYGWGHDPEVYGVSEDTQINIDKLCQLAWWYKSANVDERPFSYIAVNPRTKTIRSLRRLWSVRDVQYMTAKSLIIKQRLQSLIE